MFLALLLTSLGMLYVSHAVAGPKAETQAPVRVIGVNFNGSSERFGPLPCSCQQWECQCCANFNSSMSRRKGCLDFVYDTESSSILFSMTMGPSVIYQNEVSVANPPPACMRVPLPPYIPDVSLCVLFYDLRLVDKKLHVCINVETRIVQAPVLVFQFDCLLIGSTGVAHLKPNSSLPQDIEGNELSSLSESSVIEITTEMRPPP